MKCSICSKKIETTFLNKVVGTYMKDKNKKRKIACPECQKRFKNKEDLLNNLK